MRTAMFTTSLVTALLAGGVVTAAGAAAAPGVGPAPVEPAASVTTPGAYNALTPTRVLDSRDGTGGYTTPFTTGVTRTLQVAGRGGVPSGTAANSVVLNVTVTNATAGGYLTVYPGGPVPQASNLNFTAGQTVANLVAVPVSAAGTVSLYYSGGTGSVDVVADVNGWFVSGTPAADGAFHPTGPTRALDTRSTGGPLAPGATRPLAVAGRAGVPTNAGAVVVNVTVTDTTAPGYLTAFPTGNRPTASNLNFVAGQTVPNLVVVPLAADGTVSFYNGSSGSTDVVADVFGWFVGSAPSQAGMFGALTPARVLDTRSGTGAPAHPLATQQVLRVPVVGRGGVPTGDVSAVVLNVTAADTTTDGYLTVFPGGTRPLASTLNFRTGAVVPNLVVVPVASDGTVAVYNGAAGTVDVVADVTGYVRSDDLAVPTASTSRYVTDLAGGDSATTIATTMTAHGRSDAATASGPGAHLSILEFGAQTAKAGGDGRGGGTQKGVSLVGQDATGMRLTYAQVQTAVQAYLLGYAAGNPGGSTTVALGTNTDGFAGATYTPGAKGADWAEQVRTAADDAPPGVAVVGADDIEAGFDAEASEVRAWIAGYRSGAPVPALIDNGAADACPTTLGVTGQACGAVPVENSDPPATHTWTQADYVAFSTGDGISVAPQVYLAVQAVQWEDIALTAGGGIRFAGVLTSVAACQQRGGCSSLNPTQAWTQLTQALDSDPSTDDITVPAVTDIRYPS